MKKISYKNQYENLLTFDLKNQRIHGVLHTPQSIKTHTLVIFCGGINAERTDINNMAINFARFLAPKGIAVFRFDYRGLAISDGNSWDMTIDTKIEDIKCIVENLSEDFKDIFLLGFSDGARNILDLEEICSSIKGLIMWSPTLIYNKTQQTKQSKPFYDKKRKKLLFPLYSLYLGKEFYMNLKNKEEQVPDQWSRLKKNIFISWAEKDRIVNATKELVGNKTNKSKIHKKTILGASHLYANSGHRDELFAETYNWLEKIKS
ncbi:alpha/beta hydrolase [Bacillus toyonensis]|uniref:alpha/beta hydrolase n=1 Tax=Bacillus toyonensis TaxID=155322 RepID=UPI0034668189